MMSELRVTSVVLALGVAMLAGEVRALEPVASSIAQPASPVEVIRYEVHRTRPPERTQLWGSAESPPEYGRDLQHFVQFRNATERKVVAVQFGVVAFDVWNRFLEQTLAQSIFDLAPGETGEDTYVIYHSPEGTFLTGAIYVRKVRFDDGEIWAATLAEIAEALGE